MELNLMSEGGRVAYVHGCGRLRAGSRSEAVTGGSRIGFYVLHNDDHRPVRLSVTVYQMVRPSDGRWRRYAPGSGSSSGNGSASEGTGSSSRWKMALWAALRSGCGSLSTSS